MRDSSVVYINEALDYYFSLYFSFILGFLQLFFFHGFKVGIFDIASTQQIFSMQFNRFVHTLKSSRLGMGLLN